MVNLLIAITLRILSNPLGNVFQKQLTNNGANPYEVNFITYFLLCIPCLFFLPEWNLYPAEFWIYAVAGGLMGALGNSFLIKALQFGDLSVLGPINAYKSVFAMAAGIFLLGEIPDIIGIVGIALIIAGSYFVFDTCDEGFSLKLFRRKDIRYRILALVLTAIEAVFIKKVILLSSVSVSYVMWCLFGMFFAFFLMCKSRPKIPSGSDIKYYFSLAVCMGIMQAATNYVFEKTDVSYALALFQLSILVSVLFGYKFFHETDIKKKAFGALIMVLGAVTIILL